MDEQVSKGIIRLRRSWSSEKKALHGAIWLTSSATVITSANWLCIYLLLSHLWVYLDLLVNQTDFKLPSAWILRADPAKLDKINVRAPWTHKDWCKKDQSVNWKTQYANSDIWVCDSWRIHSEFANSRSEQQLHSPIVWSSVMILTLAG